MSNGASEETTKLRTLSIFPSFSLSPYYFALYVTPSRRLTTLKTLLRLTIRFMIPQTRYFASSHRLIYIGVIESPFIFSIALIRNYEQNIPEY